jgi:acyl-homoserine-lactone acylase
VTTPNTMNTANVHIQKAFGDALNAMKAAGLAYNVKLGTVQYVVRNGVHIPLPGGPGDPDGDFNAIYQDVFDGPTRGQEPSIGSSYIQIVGWNSAHGCPDVRTILTYSESANPKSPYFADQTKLFSKRQWIHERFCQSAVAANTLNKVTLHGN